MCKIKEKAKNVGRKRKKERKREEKGVGKEKRTEIMQKEKR